LIDHLDASLECGHINENEAERFITEIKIAIRVLNGYIRYLKQRKEDL